MMVPDSVAEVPSKPNIIVIQSDDHGYGDLSCANPSTGAATPHLDRLAASGIRFTDGYATSPVCTPSRIGLLLGAYQQRWDNWRYGGPGLPEDVPTIAEVLQDAGYTTGMVGKYHVNREFGPGWRNFPLDHGFDRFYGFNAPATHYLYRGATLEAEFMQVVREHQPDRSGYPLMFFEPLWDDRERVEPEGFSTHLFRDEAIAFMESANEQPFFLLLSFNAVHDQTAQLPPEYLEAQGLRPYEDWEPSKESGEAWMERQYAGHHGRGYLLGQLAFLDNAVGAILDYLDDSGQRSNTVIFYVSDNGGSLGTDARNDPLRGGKFSVCEGGLRIPYLVSWPGVFLEGSVLDNLVSTMDILPTAARLAGAPLPDSVDGIDLVPLLTGENPTLAHKTLFWDSGTRPAAQWAVREEDWKLYYSAPEARVTHADEGVGFRLTNLAWDIDESENLILEYPEKAAHLGALHRRWLDSVYPEQDFESSAP